MRRVLFRLGIMLVGAVLVLALAADYRTGVYRSVLAPQALLSAVAPVLALTIGAVRRWRRDPQLVAGAGALTGAVSLGCSAWMHVAVGSPEATARHADAYTLFEITALIVVLVLTVRYGAARPAAVASLLLCPAAVLRPVAVETTENGLVLALLCTFAICAGSTGAIVARLAAADRRRHAEQVRLEQRLTFARDLHDFVAHHVTGIVVQAQGAQVVAASDPQRTVGRPGSAVGGRRLAPRRDLRHRRRHPGGAPTVRLAVLGCLRRHPYSAFGPRRTRRRDAPSHRLARQLHLHLHYRLAGRPPAPGPVPHPWAGGTAYATAALPLADPYFDIGHLAGARRGPRRLGTPTGYRAAGPAGPRPREGSREITGYALLSPRPGARGGGRTGRARRKRTRPAHGPAPRAGSAEDPGRCPADPRCARPGADPSRASAPTSPEAARLGPLLASGGTCAAPPRPRHRRLRAASTTSPPAATRTRWERARAIAANPRPPCGRRGGRRGPAGRRAWRPAR
ncbi:hypothetical protein SBADM41S_07886 [Streptomyces badius]